MGDVAEVVSGLVVDRFITGVASGGNLLRKSASVGPLCCSTPAAAAAAAGTKPPRSRFHSGQDGQMPSRLPGISYLMEAEFHFAAGENSAVDGEKIQREKEKQPLMSGAERGKFFQEQNFLEKVKQGNSNPSICLMLALKDFNLIKGEIFFFPPSNPIP